MSGETEREGTVEMAMEHANSLLDADPAMAVEQAEAILEAVPKYPPAELLIAVAWRRLGKDDDALQLLRHLTEAQHRWAAAHYQYGLALGAAGQGDDAIKALRRTLELKPDHPDAWRILADHLRATGDTAGGDAAYASHVRNSTNDPTLQQAAGAMVRNEIGVAERLLKEHLGKAPTDVAAIRMLAEIAIRCDREKEARHLIDRCLELAPSFTAARYVSAVLLHRGNDSQGALSEIERCLEDDPGNPSYRNLAAVILSRVGEYERSSSMYRQILNEYPNNAKVWLSYGHVLKTEGRSEDCIAAYRRSAELDPTFGEAYWSLANMKTFRFDEADLDAMDAQLERDGLTKSSRLQFHFAAGKAYEDAGKYELSFEHYLKANALYREENRYDARVNSLRADRLIGNFTGSIFRERDGSGCASPDPIFIVGMPRSGSTLLEQMLSCHSAVEGTMELPDIMTIVKELSREAKTEEVVAYAGVLATKNADELRELGERYLERTRIHRKTDSPYFIDKLPNNFIHVGLIHLILPNAKIIDARRHPLGCCFSNFKQHYAVGQAFSYDLADLGAFYRDYVRLMAHFDAVLPGRIHRALYEDTIADTETTVRDLLNYCGLEFESDCLRFFESRRAVRTASSEQVRQPIYKEGVEHWQNYDEWLGPLKAALGDVLDQYPQVPGFES